MILVILLMPFFVKAEGTDQDLAQKLLNLEVSGFRLRAGNSECLIPEKFSGIRVPKARDTDGPIKPDCVIEDGDEVKITSVKSGDVKSVQANFQINFHKKCMGKKILNDSFTFLKNPEGDKKRGLAITTSPPKYLLVKKNCL